MGTLVVPTFDAQSPGSIHEIHSRGSMVAISLGFVRLLSMCLLMTGLGNTTTVSIRWRFAFAVVLTIFAIPVLSAVEPSSAAGGIVWLKSVLAEVVLGASFGLGLALWFLGADVCAQLWSQLSGLSIDAFAGDQDRPWARFFHLVWATTFFVSGGHRWALRQVLDGLQHVPPGTVVEQHGLILEVFALLSVSLRLGLQAGLPIAATLVAAIAITAVAGRLIPQVQVFVTTTSIGALMLIGALAVGCGPLVLTLDQQVEAYFNEYVAHLFVVDR